MSNVEYTYPENSVEYDNPVEDFSQNVRQTYVFYKKSTSHGELRYFGPVTPLFEFPPTEDAIEVKEDFLRSFEFDLENEEELEVQEFFGFRQTDDIIEQIAESFEVFEEFTKTLTKAIREESEELLSISEIFSKELKEAIQRNANDGVNILEDFSKEEFKLLRESVDEVITLNETFDSNIIQIIRKFTEDAISANESFSKTYDPVGPPSDPTNVTVSHIFTGSNVIEWNYSGESVDNFRLEYQKNGGLWELEDDNISSGARSHTHAGCGTDYTNGNDIKYRIRAENSAGNSNWVETSTITISNC